jgi:hypothetical protein
MSLCQADDSACGVGRVRALRLLRQTGDTPAGVSSVVHGLAKADVAYRKATLARRTLAPGRSEVVALE